MTRRRNNTVIVRRDRPKEVELPNGRRFLARYKRVDQNALPANIRIRKTYRGRPAQGRRVRVRRRAKLAHQIRGKGLKSFAKKSC